MTKFYQNHRHLFIPGLKGMLSILSFLLLNLSVNAQCPPNIDFEQGTFNGWQCETGTINASGTITLNPSAPVPGRHDMLSYFPGDGVDAYGGFPKNCPNGSGHSIKLGYELSGQRADAVSYTFVIPAGQNKFSLIYNYALVLNDNGHPSNQQPRLTIDVQNLTDGTTYSCSSLSFVVSGALPGFFTSSTPGPGNTPVRCKDWSAASIDLDGNAGKTIRIKFTATGCGPGIHFGYAYIDINTECSSTFIGANYCHDDTAINVTGPYGYQSYTWWNNTFTQQLGTGQTIHFSPPPPAGTTIAVAMVPFSGYGCPDTLFSQLLDTLSIRANAGRDTFSCNKNPVPIGGPPKQGFVYHWTPATGLDNPDIANPMASPDTTTTYILKVNHNGGGCVDYDTVVVIGDSIHNTLTLNGSANFCSNNGSATLIVEAADSIQWFKNNLPVTPVNVTNYNVTQAGVYHAQLFRNSGCTATTPDQTIVVTQVPTSGFTVNNPSQCLNANQFVFTNTSTVFPGSLVFDWDLGDGTRDNNRDVTHTYTSPGDYTVKMIVATDGGPCKDSTTITVHVDADPDTTLTFTGDHLYCTGKGSSKVQVKPGFTVQWFRNNVAIPGAVQNDYTITQTGDYYAKVSTNAGCSLPTRTEHVDVYATPVAGFNENSPGLCFTGHQFVLTNTSNVAFGNPLQYTWTLGDGSPAQNTQDVNYSYATPGNFTVKLVALGDGGCADSISKLLAVYPSPKADFAAQPVCMNLQVPIANRTINNSTSTINYLWDFGNGVTSTDKNPVYAYPAAGIYAIKLSVSTAQCPNTVDTKTININVDAPARGITYPVVNAVTNFPEKLSSRNFGYAVLWTPAINLDNRTSSTPYFRSFTDQLYTIELRTFSGCVTVDTQFVKVNKKINIYVPTAFTPDNDGKNDVLRPYLMGFRKVNYFRVYDRWGKLVFQMQSDLPGWDGKVKNVPQEMQSLVWMIEAEDVDGVVHHEQGTTVLIR